MANNKKLNEVGKATQFTDKNQPTEEAKSNGQIEARKEFNVNLTLRTLAQSYNATQIAYKSAIKLAEEGKPDPLIKLLGLAKEPEKQEIDLTNKTPQIVVATQTDADLIKNIQNVKINENIL